jgi:competence protein ComEA
MAEEAFVITGRPLAAFTGLQRTGPPLNPAPSRIPQSTQSSPNTNGINGMLNKQPHMAASVVVHVAGAVRNPGVYRLPADARVEEAVKAAGGARSDAHLDAINLAARLEDGTQIYVPTHKEQPHGGALGAASYANPSSHLLSPITSQSVSPRLNSRSNKLTIPGEGTVNINKANAEELQRLPGVGPATAARILEYRKEIGTFSSPEQLMDISGIGEKKFAKMQPFVRVR